MDYGRPVLADRLAGAYVLGTLRGPARRRLEALLPAHPALRQATAEWQQRLALLADGVPAVEPPARVWERIAERTFGGTGPATAASAAPAAARWWQRAAPWRAFSGVATAAVLALLVVASRTPPPQAPVVVVLAATPEAAAAIDARFVASVSADGRALVLRPLGNVSVSAGRALELWAVPAQGAPRSLGLVRPDGATTLLRAQLLRDTAAFAVSVEPSGGSPTGAPTGPVVSVGKLDA